MKIIPEKIEIHLKYDLTGCLKVAIKITSAKNHSITLNIVFIRVFIILK